MTPTKNPGTAFQGRTGANHHRLFARSSLSNFILASGPNKGRLKLDAREQRGLVIAAMCRLNHTDGAWLVPSQSTADVYRVNTQEQTCTCLDHKEHGHKCKHIFAAEFTMRRETRPDGTVVETKTITLKEEKTYKQNWPAYNRAQQIEKDRFQELLVDLCSGINEPEHNKCGRKPHSLRDMIFCRSV